MKVKAEYYAPPIPVRQFDWCAWDDDRGQDSSPLGFGRTKHAAITDLLEQIWSDLEETNNSYHAWCISEGLIPQRKVT